MAKNIMRHLSLRGGQIESPTKAEVAAIEAARLWTRAENDPALLARLMAQDSLMNYIASFHAGGRSRQVDVESADLTPEEVMVLDAVAKLYQKLIERETVTIKEWAQQGKTESKPNRIFP